MPVSMPSQMLTPEQASRRVPFAPVLEAKPCPAGLFVGTAPSGDASRPSGASCAASRGSRLAFRGLLRWCPWLPRALLDITSNESSNDLGRHRILLGAQALEESLLAGVDEDRKSSGAVTAVPYECDEVRRMA